MAKKMADDRLTVVQMEPKNWKFEYAHEERALMDEFDSAVDLLDEGDEKEAERILRAVIEAWPLHIDAYHHLALLFFSRGDLAGALALWSKAAEIGLKSLPQDFVIGEDRLEWCVIENRPFLRAIYGYATALFEAGRVDAAHLLFNQLLALNPDDNQGARGAAIATAFALERPDEVLRICNKFRDDVMVESLYGRPLALLQLGKKRLAERALAKAIGLSPFVAGELMSKKGGRSQKKVPTAFITVGGVDEAREYKERFGKYWDKTEGALEFLAEVLAVCQKRTSFRKH